MTALNIFKNIKNRYTVGEGDLSTVIFVAMWNEWMSFVSIKTPMASMKYIIQLGTVIDE